MRTWWPVALLTVLAAGLRAIGLNSGPWFDEIVTLVMSVRQPFAELVTDFSSNNVHPLYSVLAHVAIGAFGEDVWTLRLPAVVFGVACVPMLYALAREVASRDEALAAAALLAVSYHHVWFSQNARGYTALAFFAMASTLVLLRLLQEPRRTSSILMFAVVTALGAYTHLTMILMALAQAAVCAAAWVFPRAASLQRRPSLRFAPGFVLAAILTIVLYGPMLPDVYAFFTGPPQATAEVATARWAILETLRGLRIGVGAIGVVAGAALAGIGLLSYWKQSRLVVSLFVLPGVATVGAMAALGAPLRPRFVFFLSGFVLLFVVRGVAEALTWVFPRLRATGIAPFRSAPGAAVLMLMLLGSIALLPTNYRLPKQDFEGALHYVDTERPREAAIVTAGLTAYPFKHYYRRNWPEVQNLSQLEAVQRRSSTVWMVYSFPEYIEQGLRNTIRDDCKPLKSFAGTLGGGEVVVCAAVPKHGS